ncbi:hypothetical protein DCC39_16470 [Pueribacillus theae]|uniref:Uncharacterized protein n=1 Tax=Pueribacillus theae TaxID=2171751 RepID=A0A2U1JRX9_9BACI|nr:hypothetical protein DCC39_16470 [Pueribacillus theae]
MVKIIFMPTDFAKVAIYNGHAGSIKLHWKLNYVRQHCKIEVRPFSIEILGWKYSKEREHYA